MIEHNEQGFMTEEYLAKIRSCAAFVDPKEPLIECLDEIDKLNDELKSLRKELERFKEDDAFEHDLYLKIWD